MRKRKVTLTNKRKVISGANGGDKREVVRTRQVVVGEKSESLTTRAVTIGETVDNGANADGSPGNEKKARLGNDLRIFSVAEEKELAMILDDEGVEGDGSLETGTDEDDLILKADVRIIVSKNENTDSKSSEEPNLDVIAGDDLDVEHLDNEDQVDLENEEENEGMSDDERNNEEYIADDSLAELVALEDESSAFSDSLQTDEIADEVGDTEKKITEENVSPKAGQDGDLKNDEKEEAEASKTTDKVMPKEDTSDNKQSNIENKTETKNKGDVLVNGENTLDVKVSEQKDDPSEAHQTNDATSDNSSGSDSDSSLSRSSSGSSSSSSGSSSVVGEL